MGFSSGHQMGEKVWNKNAPKDRGSGGIFKEDGKQRPSHDYEAWLKLTMASFCYSLITVNIPALSSYKFSQSSHNLVFYIYVARIVEC